MEEYKNILNEANNTLLDDANILGATTCTCNYSDNSCKNGCPGNCSDFPNAKHTITLGDTNSYKIILNPYSFYASKGIRLTRRGFAQALLELSDVNNYEIESTMSTKGKTTTNSNHCLTYAKGYYYQSCNNCSTNDPNGCTNCLDYGTGETKTQTVSLQAFDSLSTTAEHMRESNDTNTFTAGSYNFPGGWLTSITIPSFSIVSNAVYGDDLPLTSEANCMILVKTSDGETLCSSYRLTTTLRDGCQPNCSSVPETILFNKALPQCNIYYLFTYTVTAVHNSTNINDIISIDADFSLNDDSTITYKTR